MIANSVVLALALAVAAQDTPPELKPITVQLNWVAEPEFGGLYAAQADGVFTRAGFKVELLQGTAGTPTCALVAAEACDIAVTQADQVLLARASGQEVVALFATFQHAPTAVMLHDSAPQQTLSQVWTSDLTIEIEPGLPFVKRMNDMLGDEHVTLVSRSPGIATFERNPLLGVVCWCSSEPITLLRHGITTKCIMISDCGFDPYTSVLVAKTSRVLEDPDAFERFTSAVREGWMAYLANPQRYNSHLCALNRAMDEHSMELCAQAQRPLIIPDAMPLDQVGTMVSPRWQTLADQMVESGILKPDFDVTQSWVTWAVDPEPTPAGAPDAPAEVPQTVAPAHIPEEVVPSADPPPSDAPKEVQP